MTWKIKPLCNVATLAETSRRYPILMNINVHTVASVTLKTLMCSPILHVLQPNSVPTIPSSLQSPKHTLAPQTPGHPSFGDLSSELIFCSIQVSISSYCLFFWAVCVQEGTLGLVRGSRPMFPPSRPPSHLVPPKCLFVGLSEF